MWISKQGFETHHSAVFRLDQRPASAIHLVIEAACITQILASPIPAPERRGSGPAVDTLPPQLAPPTASTEGTQLPPAGECQLSIK